ncbi:MAG: DNA-directed RNA polymerase subunit omega [Clostridia bacterium]|nr:DNA-directed RNA polymerase subunit omega [Clostridia bacterium]
MIVKPTVNELLNHAENRYALVIATSKRAREIAKGDEPLTKTEDKSPVTIAAEEIADEKVFIV